MLIVTEHHRDAKEGKRRATYSLMWKSESTDHHMLNAGKHIWFLLGFPKTILIHSFILTIRTLLSVSPAQFKKKRAKNLKLGSVRKYSSLKRLLKSDCVPALTLLKSTFCKRRDRAGEQMSLEPPTESDIGQEGIKADLSAEGMIESRTRGAE